MTWLKHNGSTVRIFSDKNIFTVGQKRNIKTDRFLTFCVDEMPPINNTKHPAHAMMLGVIASNDKWIPLLWFPSGTRVGIKEYLKALKIHMKPWVEATFPNGQ